MCSICRYRCEWSLHLFSAQNPLPPPERGFMVGLHSVSPWERSCPVDQIHGRPHLSEVSALGLIREGVTRLLPVSVECQRSSA